MIEDTVYQLIDPVGVSAGSVEYENSWGVERIGSGIAHANNILGYGTRVAVLDTGIDYAHQELADTYYGGWDFVFDDNDPYDDSWNSHGTHVAGIIAAGADGNGVVGVSPGAELYAVKVLDGGGFGLLSWIIKGLEWAVDSGMDVVNISIGGPHSEALAEACDAAYNAGILLVAAAGNGTEISYPAAYDSVIAVTGTDHEDLQGWFAPYGTQIELSAPGVIIRSTSADNNYAELSGTSQAAPHVSGLAALIIAAGTYDLNGDGNVDNRDVRLQMQMSAHDLGETGRDDIYGFGLVDVAAALELSDEEDFSGLTFELIKKNQHWKNFEKVTLAGMLYEVTVVNNSLRAVGVVVYDEEGKRKDLSRIIRFSGQSGQADSFWLDARRSDLQVVFMPVGKPGNSAVVSITK
ncbi:MAG: S8 family peptidase [Desulfobulbaceae bacterium]|nr:S8 family peptidase [Desulfobulbaceae bacterium]